MTLEHYKQLDDLFLDETNVKEYERVLGNTSLIYNRQTRTYRIEIKSDTLYKILDKWWSERINKTDCTKSQ